jgi:DNA-binding response OmpR family regulator
MVEAYEHHLLVIDRGLVAEVVALLTARIAATSVRSSPQLVVGVDGAVHGLGREVMLATGECRLLSYLVAMRGRWRPARTILREVFERDDASGTALVWKYISGLRKKLQPAGAVIESSPKRGYRLAQALHVALESTSSTTA